MMAEAYIPGIMPEITMVFYPPRLIMEIKLLEILFCMQALPMQEQFTPKPAGSMVLRGYIVMVIPEILKSPITQLLTMVWEYFYMITKICMLKTILFIIISRSN